MSRLAVVSALLAFLLPLQAASGAELTWNAPPGCAGEVDVREQVERLLGRELAGVEGMDFDVRITQAGSEAWSLELSTRTISDRGVRRLSGKTCDEVVQAGAIAIAMAVEGKIAADEEPEPEEQPEPAEAAPAESAVLQPAPQAPALERSEEHPQPQRSRSIQPALALGATGDVGTLPGPTAGAEIGLNLTSGALRLTALGALYAERGATISGGRGGDFTLVLGGVLACAQRGFGRLSALACGGGELGRLSGEGSGVVDAKLGDALWSALRFELGVVAPLSAGLSLEGRLGAAIPLERRTFVIDGDDVVHRPSAVVARGFLGVSAQL